MFQFLAAFACALFAGAALYVNLVEHPARVSCGVTVALAQWAPSYQRATRMQAPLAVIGLICALIAWFEGAGYWWLIGAILLGAVVPFTFLVIMPTNQRLLAPDLDSAEARRLLQKWNALHGVRTALSLVALVIFLGACSHINHAPRFALAGCDARRTARRRAIPCKQRPTTQRARHTKAPTGCPQTGRSLCRGPS
ncbi:MAG: DUF1772 domain-containing protein [Burkholderiales bacterium]|nr:DUF1772 domain-containing protein [Burkholderiales bacterium]